MTKPFPFLVIQYLCDARFPGDELYLPRLVFVHTDAAGLADVSEEFLQIVRFRARA